MSYTLRFLFLFISMQLLAQDTDEIYSVYFDIKSNPGTKKLDQINTANFNRYSLIPRNENDLRSVAGDELIVDETGIYLEKNKLLSISREEIRENSHYHITNGYLFGLIENDSVMVALDGESYYFLLPKKTYLFQTNHTKNKLYQGVLKSDYIVFSMEDNGYFSVIYISFSGDKIVLKELDFEQKNIDYRTVKNKKTTLNKIPAYILNPAKKEWEKIMQNFIAYDTYIKIKE